MSFSNAIRPHLPYLRRYARILTGSQASGDAYVRACLEAVLANPQGFDRDDNPKIALYQLFHATWDSTGGGDYTSGVDQRLSQITPAHRQVMLLTSVEGFSVPDAARIMRISREEAEQALVNAQRELERGLATSVLIIEDEPIIALDLTTVVERLGHRVCDTARTRKEAVQKANQHHPGLVLADIQLADNSSGIDAVRDILSGHDVPVIFITAYPERLLTGERPEPTYLITKPFMPETVAATISQALFFAAEPAEAS